MGEFVVRTGLEGDEHSSHDHAGLQSAVKWDGGKVRGSFEDHSQKNACRSRAPGRVLAMGFGACSFDASYAYSVKDSQYASFRCESGGKKGSHQKEVRGVAEASRGDS